MDEIEQILNQCKTGQLTIKSDDLHTEAMDVQRLKQSLNDLLDKAYMKGYRRGYRANKLNPPTQFNMHAAEKEYLKSKRGE